jgi:hypothetical protein
MHSSVFICSNSFVCGSVCTQNFHLLKRRFSLRVFEAESLPDFVVVIPKCIIVVFAIGRLLPLCVFRGMQLYISRLNALWVLEAYQFMLLLQASAASRTVCLVSEEVVVDVRVYEIRLQDAWALKQLSSRLVDGIECLKAFLPLHALLVSLSELSPSFF